MSTGPASPGGSAVGSRPCVPEISAITDLFAGVRMSDLDVSIDWYARYFGRRPDSRVGEQVLWEIDEHAWLFIEHEPIETYSTRLASWAT
jgi:hypothetical protein